MTERKLENWIGKKKEKDKMNTKRKLNANRYRRRKDKNTMEKLMDQILFLFPAKIPLFSHEA